MANPVLEGRVRTSSEPPLVVDLDGTLVHADTLFEGVARLVRDRPGLVLAMLPSALAGRAALKEWVASRVALDVARLPLNTDLVDFLHKQRETRSLILCTGADYRFAHAVAEHVGVFDEVIATREGVNMRGERKAQELVERFGAGGFDYVGNDVPDLPVFEQARRAHLVNPTGALRRRKERVRNTEPIPGGMGNGGTVASYAHAMRTHQWVKNLLVFLPAVATLQVAHLEVLLPAMLAFLSFGLVASSVYLLNDILDLEADRSHPRKRNRPLASGAVPLKHAFALIPLLLAAGFSLGLAISTLFTAVLCLYYVVTLLYTFVLKRVVLLDTLVLSGLYTLRILAGAAAIVVVPSFWLLAFSMFFFLSIAQAKRHAELVEVEGSGGSGAIPGREYRKEDLATLIAQGSASGYAAVLVLALYINSDTVRAQYNNPEIIWLICPLLLYWINKLWLNAQRREIEDDPLVWAMQNRVSRGIAGMSIVLLLLARWLPPFI